MISDTVSYSTHSIELHWNKNGEQILKHKGIWI